MRTPPPQLSNFEHSESLKRAHVFWLLKIQTAVTENDAKSGLASPETVTAQALSGHDGLVLSFAPPGADVEQVKPPAWISGSIWRIRLLSVLTQIFENLLWKACAEFQINFVRICENSYMVIGLSILYQQLQLAVSI